MTSAGERTAGVIILVLMTLYACYAFYHIADMWKMRKEFLIALRCRMFCFVLLMSLQ